MVKGTALSATSADSDAVQITTAATTGGPVEAGAPANPADNPCRFLVDCNEEEVAVRMAAFICRIRPDERPALAAVLSAAATALKRDGVAFVTATDPGATEHLVALPLSPGEDSTRPPQGVYESAAGFIARARRLFDKQEEDGWP